MINNDWAEQLKQRVGINRLNSEQCNAIVGYVSAFSYATAITVERASRLWKMEADLVKEVLNTLVEIGKLKSENGIRCPKCGLFYEKVDDPKNVEREESYCCGCENDIEVDASDIDVIYSLRRESA
jgi:DNA-directed RNA polymerase subunit RPC12/RpoP